MQEKSIELKSLVGLHRLSGVGIGEVKVKSEYGDYFDDCQSISFILDGKTYTALEDPEDGYRSCMKSLFVSKDKISNKFKPCKVMCQMRPDESYESHDVLDMVDVKTGKVVLSVGTGDTDDYYPYFVASFHPENMAINAALIKATVEEK